MVRLIADMLLVTQVLALGLARIDCCDVRTTGASNDGALGIARNLIAQPHLLQLRVRCLDRISGLQR